MANERRKELKIKRLRNQLKKHSQNERMVNGLEGRIKTLENTGNDKR